MSWSKLYENPLPRTPGGYAYTEAQPFNPLIGETVVVVSRWALEQQYRGKIGIVLGYSVPHGMAIVSIEGKEVLLHPEGIKAIKSTEHSYER